MGKRAILGSGEVSFPMDCFLWEQARLPSLEPLCKADPGNFRLKRYGATRGPTRG